MAQESIPGRTSWAQKEGKAARGEVPSQKEARPPSSSTQPLISGRTHILLPSGHEISVYIHSEDKQTYGYQNVFL